MNKKRVFSIALVVIILSAAIYYFNSSNPLNKTASHHAIAELVQINGNKLVFATQAMEEIRAEAPEIVLPFLEKGKRYSITVDTNKKDGAILKEIKLSDVQ